MAAASRKPLAMKRPSCGEEGFTTKIRHGQKRGKLGDWCALSRAEYGEVGCESGFGFLTRR